MSRGNLPTKSSQHRKQRVKLQLSVIQERVVHGVLALAASIPVIIALSILAIFLYHAWMFFQQVPIWEFFTDTEWTPDYKSRQFGVIVLINGTLTITAIAMLVAIPTGILAAIYLSEYANPSVRRFLKPSLEALSGIPTIAYGYFAILFLTPFLKHVVPGLPPFNALSAGLMTGILITPIVSSISEDAFHNVPTALREGGYALGFTKREVTLKILLPVAFPGIVAALTLAASRSLGETIIASIAAGQNPQLTLNPLIPVESITAYMVQVSLGGVATGSLRSHTIFTLALVLFVVTFALNGLGHWLVRRHSQEMSGLVIPQPELTEQEQKDMEASQLNAQIELTPSQQENLFFAKYIQRNRFDTLFEFLSALAAFVGILVFALLVIVTLQKGAHQLDWVFLSSFPSRNPEEAGIYAALIGTLWILVGTVALAFPIGLGAAIYLEEYLPQTRLSELLEIHLANMAAVPPIIYGLLGLAVFSETFGFITGGNSILAAILTIGILILPPVIITARTTLRSVPGEQRQAGYAVGMSRWQVIWSITLPRALPGLVTGMFLAISRAIGETAPLIAVGAVAFLRFTPSFSVEGLQTSFTTLTTQIFFWVSKPQEAFRENAAAAILVLGAIVLFLNIVAVLLRDISRHRR
jgi:phosphate transport system permease protein